MTEPPWEPRAAVRLGIGFLAGGFALLAFLFLAGGWPTIAPLVIAALGIPPILLGLLGRRASPLPGPLDVARRRPFLLSALFLGGVFTTAALALGVEREETHPMIWSYATDDEGRADRTHILLEFEEHPGWVSRIRSRDLGPYLESLGTDRVPVTFLVTRDLGRMRSFIETRVGALTTWDDLGGGGVSRRATALSRARGGIGPPPFRR